MTPTVNALWLAALSMAAPTMASPPAGPLPSDLPPAPVDERPTPPTPPTPFGPPPGPLRGGGGFGTGQLSSEVDATEDHVRTAQLTLEWLGPAWRAGLGYRAVLRDVERHCEPVAGESTPGRCPQGGARGRDNRHALGATAGWSATWLGGSLGLGWHTRHRLAPDGTTATDNTVAPWGQVRLGPSDGLSLRAAWHDPGIDTPGQGDLRGGVEFTPGAGRLLVGAVHESPAWGLLLAGQVPLGQTFALSVSGAAHPLHPERLILVGVGLLFGWDVVAEASP